MTSLNSNRITSGYHRAVSIKDDGGMEVKTTKLVFLETMPC
jgi:hypothetical protein